MKNPEQTTIDFLCSQYNVSIHSVVITTNVPKDGYIAGYPRAVVGLLKEVNPSDKQSCFDGLVQTSDEAQVFDTLLEAVLAVIARTPFAFTKDAGLAPYQEAKIIQVKKI